MTLSRAPRRLTFLAVALLSACAAADGSGGGAGFNPSPSNAFGAYLAGRFATSESDTRVAADSMLAGVTGAGNYVEVEEQYLGSIGWYGPGAGALPTAHAMAGDAASIRAAGIDHIMTKPLRRGAICDMLTSCTPAGVRPPLAAPQAETVAG